MQYAHARCGSVLERVGAEATALVGTLSADGRAALLALPVAVEPAEKALVLKLGEFPEAVAQASDRRAPHRIATYALELAQTFTAFYRDCRSPVPKVRASSRGAPRSPPSPATCSPAALVCWASAHRSAWSAATRPRGRTPRAAPARG